MKSCFHITEFSLLTLLLLLSMSCTKEIVYEGPEGELRGLVFLYENDGRAIYPEGVKVTVDGASPATHMLTDKDGKFSFPNLKSGIYDIIFEKEGCPTYKLLSHQFVGGEIPEYLFPLIMYKFPEIGQITFSVDTGRNTDGSYFISINVPATEIPCRIMYYISDRPDLSYLNYRVVGSFEANAGIGIRLRTSDLPMFSSGQKVFVKVYTGVANYNMVNFDRETGKLVFPVNPASDAGVKEIIIPE